MRSARAQTLAKTQFFFAKAECSVLDSWAPGVPCMREWTSARVAVPYQSQGLCDRLLPLATRHQTLIVNNSSSSIPVVEHQDLMGFVHFRQAVSELTSSFDRSQMHSNKKVTAFLTTREGGDSGVPQTGSSSRWSGMPPHNGPLYWCSKHWHVFHCFHCFPMNSEKRNLLTSKYVV